MTNERNSVDTGQGSKQLSDGKITTAKKVQQTATEKDVRKLWRMEATSNIRRDDGCPWFGYLQGKDQLQRTVVRNRHWLETYRDENMVPTEMLAQMTMLSRHESIQARGLSRGARRICRCG